MKLIKTLIPFLFMVSGVSAQSAIGVLGTPANGSTVSGVSTISGYHCTSKNIEVFIDGVSFGKAGSGTQLLGTQGVCGRTDTGYSLLYNFSNLADGQHTIAVTADGAPFGTNTVTTVKSGGVQWLTGASKEIKVPDFPLPGQAANLQWVQSYQNFLVTGIGDTAGDLSSLNGTYTQNASISVSGSSCYLYNFLTGNQELLVTAGAGVAEPSVIAIYVFPDTFTDMCLFALTTYSGNSATGYNLNGTVGCAASETMASVVATGIRKAEDGQGLLGTVTSYYPGCTHTSTLY
jgi:hypothetical protein